MNKFIYSNIKISPIYGLSLLRKHINKGITDISIENITNRYKEIELENKKYVSSKKTNEKLQTIIKLSDKIINSNKSQLNLLDKNQFNLNFSNINNLKDLNNLYTICKSAFLNMSSIISKPIVSINPNLLKITLFYY